MAREYQNGDGFGYILAFKKNERSSSWEVVRIPHVESSRYVYYNSSLEPYSPFDVKIKAYNRRGDGAFSQIAVVHSAEEGESNFTCATCIFFLINSQSSVCYYTLSHKIPSCKSSCSCITAHCAQTENWFRRSTFTFLI